jgi:hypothetical protein
MEIGEWAWGHDTAVEEDFIGDLTDGSGTGTIVDSGDDEKVCIDEGEYWTFDPVNVGGSVMEILYDHYQSGSGVAGTIEYKTGSTRVLCLADSWHTYTVPFSSSGWVQIRLSK